MYDAFNFVYFLLDGLAQLTGLGYKTINIIIFYAIIPMIYCFLLDKLMEKHYFKLILTFLIFLFLLLVDDINLFSEKLFDKSVMFLESFEIIGWDYIEASVLICVIFPFLVFLFLILLINREKIRKELNRIEW